MKRTCHITADNDHPCTICGAPFNGDAAAAIAAREWASVGNIECRCGDLFPSVPSFHEHIHLSHPDADHPFAPFDDPEDENADLRMTLAAASAELGRLRHAIEDFILWWDMPPFALDDDERLRAEVDALREAIK